MRIRRLKKSIINVSLFLLSIFAVFIIFIYGKQKNFYQLAGNLIIVSSCFIILLLFLFLFRREVLDITRKTVVILVAIVVMLLITRYITEIQKIEYLMLVPYAVIPVIVITFYDARLALFVHLIAIILTGFLITDPFRFVFMNFISGLVAIFTLTNIYRRKKLLFTALMVFISYSLLDSGLKLMEEGSIRNINLSGFMIYAGNAVILLISYPVILLFENKFLFLSDSTLLELADTNQPLLRKLAEEAPGSFQHSLQVANLAEEAARVINANLLLVRTGALYHDIGKVANPTYFIENLTDGTSIHENLDPRDSGRLIINHVKNGVILARNYKIPVQIIDFIRTHHGTSVAFFFYRKFLDKYPDEKDARTEFSYPGPKPFSKETAVVMMADAVEAASRTLDKYTEESISELVERVILIQEQDGQYSDVPLTYKNISDIREVFKKRLINIYHARIAYPDRN